MDVPALREEVPELALRGWRGEEGGGSRGDCSRPFEEGESGGGGTCSAGQECGHHCQRRPTSESPEEFIPPRCLPRCLPRLANDDASTDDNDQGVVVGAVTDMRL